MSQSSFTIKSAARRLKVTEHLAYRDYLRALFELMKHEVPGYSHPRFADDLGFGPTNVVRLALIGRRNISDKGAAKIVAALGFTGVHRRYFLTLVRHNNAKDTRVRDDLFAKLVELKGASLKSTDDRLLLDYLSEWYHPIIRELVGLPDFRSDAQWIIGRLRHPLTPTAVQESLELLERIGVIRFDEAANRHVKVDQHVVSSKTVGTIAAVGYHQAMLDLAKASITTIPEDERDINSMTVTLSPAGAQAARAEIERTLETILALEQRDPETPDREVFMVTTQAFPITRARKRRDS